MSMYHKNDFLEISNQQKDFLKKVKKRKTLVRSTQIILLVAFFILWEAAANANWIDPFLFSQPSRMITAERPL